MKLNKVIKILNLLFNPPKVNSCKKKSKKINSTNGKC